MILGIGVDLVHLARIAKMVAGRHGRRFPARILSSEEVKEFDFLGGGVDRRMRYLAVRWAVKEAAYKALYPTIRPSWKDLSLLRRASDAKPRLELDSGLLPEASTVDLQVSISHDGDYVVASVLAQKS
ncbi:4'-phosphopantetheinyl transferase superfamily [Pterulicium gracile]|uniref:4'-phosphopantetheinyl transferase superfamily n=1 Tax=Pterulicium gracile TaxID=1884261 RepID=A0A5C3QYS7_9AGAR|nr:4'-phosphopantetheinyl transferase superfamily [Pterula gracilis]